jgi:hypothetical protein
MTTEDMIEEFIDLGMKAYKKLSGNSSEAMKLNRHEPIIVDGHEFSYWREYVVYKMAQYIHDILPQANITVELEGNESTIQVELDDMEQQKLNREMFLLLEKVNKKQTRVYNTVRG